MAGASTTIEQSVSLPADLVSLADNRVTIAHLVEQLQTGGVIPFVGAGMSVPFGLPDWKSFLTSLAPDGLAKKRIKLRLAKGDYEEAAESLLHWRGGNALQDGIDFTFGPKALRASPADAAIRRLPELCAGPVLTTNFDSVLERVFEEAQRPFKDKDIVVGMQVDRLRKAVHQRGRVLVHLHGTAIDRTDRVFTLSEYRKRYGVSSPLEAVLRLVMTWPLLFLGCSLNNDRPVRALRKLGAELRRRKAEALLAHYAVLEYPSDADKLRRRLGELARMGVKPIWYPTGKRGLIRDLLDFLVEQTGRGTLGRLRFPHLFPTLTTGLGATRGFTALEQFLSLYLVSPGRQQPPFVGRAKQLRELNDWLGRPDASYALIVEAAGRGKSALVTRWAHDVAQSGRAQVAFAPISLRFDLATASEALAILGHRLRSLRADHSAGPREAVGWARDIEASVRMPSLDTPLLVVLDGVDEATGWTVGEDLLFPTQPGPGVKVLVTARALANRDASGWLRLLKWEGRAQEIQLPPLRRENLREAIRAWGAGLPRQIDSPVVIDRLWHLTQGDPLLMKLYFDGLAVGDIPINKLSKIVPGLQGYFGEWWTQQKKQWGSSDPLDRPAVQETLCALSCTLGPIGQRELVAVLAPEVPPREVEKALLALDRLVTRVHGWKQVAYVFSHPRLGEFVHELYVSPDQAWDARFARCGSHQIERLRRSELAPDDVSPYFLQHHGHHLERSGAEVGGLAALVSKPWLDAWRASEKTEWGFLQDADRLRRLATRSNQQEIARLGRAPHLHHEARWALVRASLVSVSRGTPPELLGALIDRGVWDIDRALVDAREAPRPLERALALAAIARRLRGPDARDLLDEAAALARELEGKERCEAFRALTLTSVAVGDIEGAARAQRHVDDQWWRRNTLIANAERFVSVLDADTLFRALEGLDGQRSVDVLLAMAENTDGDLRRTLSGRATVAADSLWEVGKGIALLRLTRIEPERQADLIDRALALAEGVAEWGMGEEHCAEIFAQLPPVLDEEQLARARAVPARVEQGGSKSGRVLAELVRFRPSEEQREARRQVLTKLLGEGLRHSKAQERFARWVGDFDTGEAVGLLESFRQEGLLDFAPIILRLADRVSASAFEAAARDIFTAALAKDRYLWVEIAPHVPDGRWPEAWGVLRDIVADDTLPLTKPRAISAAGVLRRHMTKNDIIGKLCDFLQVAAAYLPEESVEAAVAFARSATDPNKRCVALTALLPRVTAAAQPSVARDALAAAHDSWLADEMQQQLLIALPLGLPLELQREAVRLAARQFRDKRASAAATLAPKLDAELLEDLRSVARKIDDGYSRATCAEALVAVATPRAASQWAQTLLREGHAAEATSMVSRIPPDEVPALLALHESISYPDHSAAYIVALAPRLDREQVGDAIQRLERLQFDWRSLRDRYYLSALAQRAIQLERVDEALRAIERWPDEFGRAHALFTVCGELVPAMFERLERVARGIKRDYARRWALCALAPLAPDPGGLRTEVLPAPEDDPAFSLIVLAADWRDEFPKRPLWQSVTKDQFRRPDLELLDAALDRCAPELREFAVSRLLEQCESIPKKESYRYTELLHRLPRHCGATHLGRIALLAHQVRDVHDWVRVVRPLLERAPPERRGSLKDEALFVRDRGGAETDIINDVIGARFGPEAERRSVIQRALQAVRQDQTWLLGYVAPLMALQPADECYRYVSEVMVTFATRGRDAWLDAMRSLTPAVGHVASPDDVANILTAVQEVSDWWP